MLLQSSDVHIVLGVLSLLYVFSKRSNFITRLQLDKKQALIGRLIFLAEVKIKFFILFRMWGFFRLGADERMVSI